MSKFDLVLPDGMPVVWALNMRGAGLSDRVYGPYFMKYVLERTPRPWRHFFFGDTEETVAKKTKAALAAGLTPVVCVGEHLSHRESGQTHKICKAQFDGGPGLLTPDEFSRVLIAYEPVWAIGTGRTATPEMAAEVHKFLRQLAAEKFSAKLAEALRILYGGSVKPDNIKGLMAQEELDGALVGGASLDAKSFASIVNFTS